MPRVVEVRSASAKTSGAASSGISFVDFNVDATSVCLHSDVVGSIGVLENAGGLLHTVAIAETVACHVLQTELARA